jgi:NAD(P)-dependent dehydrogenase (short-subunit alcohol dehydrogenase family)
MSAAIRRVAIVTGAASGIGKEIALRLAKDGLNVALNDLPGSLSKLKDMENLASKHRVEIVLVPGDVSSESDVQKMVNDTVKLFGGLDAVRFLNCPLMHAISRSHPDDIKYRYSETTNSNR